MNKYNKNFNFTVIELLAAITIIIILVAITVGVYSYIATKTKNDRTEALIKKLELAMRSYKHDTGYYFQQSTPGSLTINSSDTEFLKHIDYTRMLNSNEISGDKVVDAWSKDIIYECPGTHNTTMFDLGSKGKNGLYGNSDNIADFGTVDDITNFSKN
jgi:type II secretory pathway pseudopilin PulG